MIRYNNNIMTMLLLALTLMFSVSSRSQSNIISIIGGYVAQSDTLHVSLCADNDDPFVSFQCDVKIPEGMLYVEESASVSNRAADHSISVANPTDNTLRLFAYSLNNSSFTGTTGEVASFDIFCGEREGTWPLVIENAILGNESSQNILTETVDGEITVTPSGISNVQSSCCSIFVVYDRITWSARLQVELTKPADLILQVVDSDGRLLWQNEYNNLVTGQHQFPIISESKSGMAVYSVITNFKDKTVSYKTGKVLLTNLKSR